MLCTAALIWVKYYRSSYPNCSYIFALFSWTQINTNRITYVHTHAPILKLKRVSVYYHQYNYVHIIKFSHDTQFNCNENQTRTFLKKYMIAMASPSFPWHTLLTFTHSLIASFLLRKKIASFPMSLSQKK